jgi:hypothetical protein
MFNSKRLKKPPCHLDNLSIQSRVGITDSLKAELIVLPIASCLWSLIPENGSQVIKLHRLRQIVHSMLKICPAHRRRPFRPESQYIAAPVFESIHLLDNDIGAFTYTSGEKLRVLKSRRI